MFKWCWTIFSLGAPAVCLDTLLLLEPLHRRRGQKEGKKSVTKVRLFLWSSDDRPPIDKVVDFIWTVRRRERAYKLKGPQQQLNRGEVICLNTRYVPLLRNIWPRPFSNETEEHPITSLRSDNRKYVNVALALELACIAGLQSPLFLPFVQNVYLRYYVAGKTGNLYFFKIHFKHN